MIFVPAILNSKPTTNLVNHDYPVEGRRKGDAYPVLGALGSVLDSMKIIS
jgi:hypothetical protein